MPQHLREVAQDFERLGEQIALSPHADPFEVVARLALERLPHARAVSITTVKNDRFVTAASTDELAVRADAIQYQLESGPCIDAIRDHAIYYPRDLALDHRWPEYGQRVVAELGLRSMLSFRMKLEFAEVIAGMNFYSAETDAFDDGDLAEGLLLTTHAAQVVAAAQLHDRSLNLERALATSRDIGVAIGVLMGVHKLGRTEAFNLLKIASQNTNQKLHRVALGVIETGTVDVIPEGRP
ncbi:GAF and ANTAR domain-containing protein [Humibacillus xanthopallidus]|nr:GAF and ANTAR domain-containing protein [Humibacillus xanthopallidus]